MKKEIELLKRSVHEIRELRNQNVLMDARLEMFDKMFTLFTTEPAHSGLGMSPDLAIEIENFINKKAS